MAGLVIIGAAVCCSMCCGSPFTAVYFAPKRSDEFAVRLKKVLPDTASDFIPDKPSEWLGSEYEDDYDPVKDEEDELQLLRNELSALYGEDEAAELIVGMAGENEAENMQALLQLKRGKKYYEDERSTTCFDNIYDMAAKVDCGQNAVKRFKLSTCLGGKYKYEYTCLGGINAKISDTNDTPPVTPVSLGENFLEGVPIDMRTIYRHNVSCDVGGTGSTAGGDDTPITQFRYDYTVVPGKPLMNTTKYYYRCLDTIPLGKCYSYETSTSALKPEDLVTDGALGLQSHEIKCPGETQVLTRFQLKAGGTAGDGTEIPPEPVEGGTTTYRYDYTCCNMKAEACSEEMEAQGICTGALAPTADAGAPTGHTPSLDDDERALMEAVNAAR